MNSNLKDSFRDFIDQNASKALQGISQETLNEMTVTILTLTGSQSDCISCTNILLASVGSIFKAVTVLPTLFKDPNWQINCTLFISKLNGEVIPVFAANSLKEAEDSANANYLANIRHSEQSDWSFVIVSDFLHWTLYALDQKERKLWAHNFDISNPSTSTESIQALLRHLIVLVGYNQQNKSALSNFFLDTLI
jgi:hypothetical protein